MPPINETSLIQALAESYQEIFSKPLIASQIYRPVNELCEEYSKLNNRQWKKKRQLEKAIFRSAYRDYEKNLLDNK